MRQPINSRTLLRSSAQGYAIASLLATAALVVMSHDMPRYPLTFAFRFTVAVGAVGAYLGYKRALRKHYLDAAQQPSAGEAPALGGWGLFAISALVIGGSVLIVCLVAVFFNAFVAPGGI